MRLSASNMIEERGATVFKKDKVVKSVYSSGKLFLPETN